MIKTPTECVVIEAHFIGDYSAAPVRIPAITPARFEGFVSELLRTHSPMAPNDLHAYFEDGKPLPPKCFLFTFDDGIRDQLTNAMPILQRYGLKAAFYIPGSVFDDHGRLPILERQRFLQYAFPTYREFLDRFVIAAQETNSGRAAGDLAPTDAAIAHMGNYLAEYEFYTTPERYYRFLRDKIIAPADFVSVIDRLFADRFESDRALLDTYYVSKADARELRAAGMEVGCHGFAHEHLPRLADQRADVERGLTMLTKILGAPPRSMSYPFGSYDNRTLALMRDFGMSFAFTTGNRLAALDSSAPFEIPRVDISSVKL